MLAASLALTELLTTYGLPRRRSPYPVPSRTQRVPEEREFFLRLFPRWERVRVRVSSDFTNNRDWP